MRLQALLVCACCIVPCHVRLLGLLPCMFLAIGTCSRLSLGIIFAVIILQQTGDVYGESL